MEAKKKSKLIRVKGAAIKDGINYIIGLSGIPAPLETLKEILKIKREESPSHFVDWELENWPEIYHKELERCIKLPYKGKEYFLPQVLVFDNIKKKLNLSSIHLCPTETFFNLRDDVRAFTEEPFEKLLNYLRNGRRYSNEQNLRLVDIIEEEKSVIIKVQPVEYKYFVHTNLVLDARSKGKKYTLREYLHRNGKLEDFKESPLANHLGINILLFTADGSLIMQKRSKVVAFRTKELCPAASGAISLTDVPAEITLEQMPKLREAFEEIGITKADIPTDEIFFLGITRELIRGGKPEMFFFAKTNLSEKQITEKWKDARDKWETEKIIFFNFGQVAYESHQMEIHKLLSKIDEFIDKYMDQSSIPLLTSIALWVKYWMEDD